MNIPLCYKCSNKIVQLDMLDKRLSYVAGCKQLSKTQWEKGYKKNRSGILCQHNCPLSKF